MATERDLELTWRSFSLWKRDGDQQGVGLPPFIRDLAVATSRQSLRLLRVFEALRDADRAEEIQPLYLAWGERIFKPGPPTAPDEMVVKELVLAAGLEGFVAAADDERWDAEIEQSMGELAALAGPTPLVPTLVSGDPPRVIFTGAIVSAPVPADRGLLLWDAVETLTEDPAFTSLTTNATPMPSFA